MLFFVAFFAIVIMSISPQRDLVLLLMSGDGSEVVALCATKYPWGHSQAHKGWWRLHCIKSHLPALLTQLSFFLLRLSRDSSRSSRAHFLSLLIQFGCLEEMRVGVLLLFLFTFSEWNSRWRREHPVHPHTQHRHVRTHAHFIWANIM